MYKENYLKSFFKSFGIIPAVATVLILTLAAYIGADGTLVNESISDIINGLALAGMGLAVVLGLSGLKNEKINFTDFIRFAGAVSSIIMAIVVLVKDETSFGIVYIVLAVVSIVELICRFIFCKEANEDSSFKNYFANLAGKYNPLLILALGTILAIVLVVLAKSDFSNKIDVDFREYKYLFVGAAGAIVVMMIVSSIDKEATVSLLDFVIAVLFVLSTFAETYMIASNQITQGGQSNVVLLAIFLAQFSSAACLIVRAVFYNGGKAYKGSARKITNYFTSVYEKFDVTLFIGLAFVAIFIVSIGAAGLYTGKWFMLYQMFEDKISVMVANIVFVVILFAFVVATVIFRKFKDKDVVKTDACLVGILFMGAFGTFYGVCELAFGDEFLDETGNIVLFAASAVALLYGAVVQFIRLKSFDQTAIFDQVLTQRQEEEVAKAEEAREQEAQEEVQETKPEENNDPFALTEEDEALFNSYYGDEAKAEEPAEEEAVEEVVEEPAEEEVEYVEEEVVEEPTEEVEYVEEVVEEAPAEEVVEEAADEEAEEDEAEEEEDEAEDEEPEEVIEGEDVEPVVLEEHKEKGIEVTDFQVLDEDGNPRKIKRRFLTKMMFAPYETKEYYNEIKNYLTMYRAKGRQSARCESFRYKGLVAKVALGGKSVKVFLALDPTFIDENPKYHLKDVSNKKQYAEVPVMIKVRSARGLKYFKELVDIMFAQRGVKPKRNFEKADYLPTLIPNGEAILATLGMETYYLQDTMNVKGIPAEMPDNLEDYIPLFPGEDLGEEEVEAVVYLDTLCNHFEDGDQVTIDVLKSLHIVNKGNVLRIKARGTLDRKLIIYAEYFDQDALKMLMCTNCTAIKIYR